MMPKRHHGTIEIVEAIGEDAARVLRTHFGGTMIYVPKRLPDTHRIVNVLGRTSADRLQAWAGGGFISVPKSDAVTLLARIQSLRAAGRTIVETAIECGISERHVYHLLKKACDDATARA